MGDYLSFFDALWARLQGPMHFRFLLQPLVAVFFAFRDARKDIREGLPPFFWTLFTDPGHRGYMIKSGWKSICKVLIIAIILDLVFQYRALRVFHPAVALVAGLVLALAPYLLVRGPLSRLMPRNTKEPQHGQSDR
jgi:hypothetical protein